MLVLTALLIVGQVSRPAMAADGKIPFRLVDCASVSDSEVRRIMALEMQSATEGREGQSPLGISITATCTADSVLLESFEPQGSPVFSRHISLYSQNAEALDRVIAIAATELALSSWQRWRADTAKTETESGDSLDNKVDNPAEQNGTTRQPEGEFVGETDEPETTKWTASLVLGGGWRMYPAAKTHLFGGEAGARLGSETRPFFLQLSLGLEGGRARRAIGTVSLFVIAPWVGAGMHRNLFGSRFEGALLIGGRGGFGRIQGDSNGHDSQSHAVNGFVAGPLLRAEIARKTFPLVGLALESGYLLSGMSGHVENAQSVEMKGAWISVLLRASI